MNATVTVSAVQKQGEEGKLVGVEIGAAAMKTRMEVPQKIKKQNYHAILAYTQTKILIKKDTCTPVFTGTRFTIAKTWNQPKCH